MTNYQQIADINSTMGFLCGMPIGTSQYHGISVDRRDDGFWVIEGEQPKAGIGAASLLSRVFISFNGLRVVNGEVVESLVAAR